MGSRRKRAILNMEANPELDVFTANVVQTSIIGESQQEYFPINPLASNQPIEFNIPESFTEMTDPNFLLKVSAKITKADGSNLAAAAEIAPVNLFLHGLFRDIVMTANGVIISQATNTYPYRAYIETNFTYSPAAKAGAVGIPQLYLQETAGKMNSTTANDNPSYDKRKAKAALSAVIMMGGRLNLDLLMQSKYIIPGVKFALTLIPATDAFRIFSNTATMDEKVQLTKCVLQIRRIKLTSTTLLQLERSLTVRPAVYDIFHGVVRYIQVQVGTTSISNLVLHNGQIPRLIIVTCVTSAAFLGAMNTNPFLLTLRSVKTGQLEVNGQLFPALPFTSTTGWIEPYLAALHAINKLFSDSSAGLTLDDFVSAGHQILAFDLSPDDAGTSNHKSPRINGVVTFNGTWGNTSFDQQYFLLYYMLFDNSIQIDSRRNVILDFVP